MSLLQRPLPRAATLAAVAAGVALAASSLTNRPVAAQTENPCANSESECRIAVTKVLTSANPVAVGGSVQFQIVVTNAGDISLTNVAVSDSYDPATLDFLNASPAPTLVDEESGVLLWNDLLPDPDGAGAGAWDADETRTLTVTFRATQTPSSENCAIAIADADELEAEVESELVCADVGITSAPPSGNRRSDRDPTSTTRPANTPPPVSTVAAATAVPPKATPRTGVVIGAPDTGTGDGRLGGGTGRMLLAFVGAVLSATVGVALIRRALE